MYMSALKSQNDFKNVENMDPVPFGDMIDVDGGVIGVQDASLPLHKAYDKCDVFLSELAWSRGTKKFSEMANYESDFKIYMMAVTQRARSDGRPHYFICGAESRKFMIGSTYKDIILNNGKAILYMINCDSSIIPDYILSSTVLLNLLAKNYDCIGDFSCGFGRSGKVFHQHNKKFVMTDINGKCIRHLEGIYGN